MIQTLVITLGDLADSMLESARNIIGDSDRIHALGLGWDNGMESMVQTLNDRLSSFDEGTSFLLLTDVFGGSASNVAAQVEDAYPTAVIAGANLPMLVKAMTLPAGLTLQEAADALCKQGRQSIIIAG